MFDGLYSLKNETLEGLSPPLNFTEGKAAPNIGCGFSVALLQGGFKAPVGPRIGNCSAAGAVSRAHEARDAGLRIDQLVVRFGGLTAVNGVTGRPAGASPG